MDFVFLKILNMSIAASWLIMAVVVLRLLLKKAPKAMVCALWVIVAVRLLCPFSLESALSLVPSAETIPQQAVFGNSFDVQSGFDVIDTPVNKYIGDHYYEGVTVPAGSGSRYIGVFATVWLVGVGAMLAYALISYLRIKKRVSESAELYDGVWLCDRIDTPFILGIARPRIYLPSAMEEAQSGYVLAHENAHLKRRDHWWKPLGFVFLAVYWFNPLCWLAYLLLCRDIEMACDEKVVKAWDVHRKKAYSEALLSLSVPRRIAAACPLAFGEVGVKERIKTVLNYKKPAFWLIIVAAAACVAVAVCFLTNPKQASSGGDEIDSGITQSANGEEGSGALQTVVASQAEYDSVCLAIKPTGVAQAGGDYSYIIPGEQEKWLAAWNNSVAKAAEDTVGDWTGQLGIWALYQGDWWQLVESGALTGSGGRIEAQDAAELYSLCLAAARDAGYGAVVRPPAVAGVVSATLDWIGTQTTTDSADLARIEAWLSQSTELYGGADCWFTARLTLELESGESLTVSMATDGCSTWMSEGVCYKYPADGNADFYSIFSSVPVYEAAQEGMDSVLPLMPYIDWSRYAKACGTDKGFELMDMLKAWAAEDGVTQEQRIERFMSVMSCTRGLDGAYSDAYAVRLHELYDLDSAQFAWCALGNLSGGQSDTVVGLLAYDMGVSSREARELLEGLI